MRSIWDRRLTPRRERGQLIHATYPRPRSPPKTDLLGPKPVRPISAASVSALAVACAVTETQRRVPTPIKIPRMHVHAPSVAIEHTAAPSPSPLAPLTSNLPPAQTPTTGSLILPSPDTPASIISKSAPEPVAILRAERASAADSAALPREGPYSSWLSVANPPFGSTSGAGPSGLLPIPASCAGSSAGPSSEGVPSPVPASASVVEANTQGQPLERVQTQEAAPSSPLRVRSETLIGHGPRQRFATVNISPHVATRTIPHVSGLGVASSSGSGVTHMGVGQVPSGARVLHRPRPRDAILPAITPPGLFPTELVGVARIRASDIAVWKPQSFVCRPAFACGRFFAEGAHDDSGRLFSSASGDGPSTRCSRLSQATANSVQVRRAVEAVYPSDPPVFLGAQTRSAVV
ncbi:hypothetical protein FRC12_004065 [Ceratobasidium sp. 428]|nr:hypothetical protein FRC12_004065 [Ceratobasidium sp. 428]